MKRGVKKREPIKTESYIPIDGKRYKVSDLNEEQKAIHRCVYQNKTIERPVSGPGDVLCGFAASGGSVCRFTEKKG